MGLFFGGKRMFRDIMFDYHFNIITLLSFMDRIDTFLSSEFESHNERISTNLKEFITKVISKEKLEYFLENIEENLDEETFLLSNEFKVSLTPVKDITEERKNTILGSDLIDEEDFDKANQLFEKLLLESTDFLENNKLLRVLYNENYLLYQSTLINLVTAFEVLISKIFKIHLTKGFASLNSKTITISELLRYNSLEDAKKSVIEDEVKNIMFSSVVDWFIYFSKKMNINCQYYNDNQNEVFEIFARRNLMVHNSGYINDIYLHAIDEKLRVDLVVGEKIKLGKSYLQKSLKQLSILGYQLIIMNAAKHKELNDELVKYIINEVLFTYHVKNREWDLSANMYKFLMVNCELSASDRLLCQMNYWMSMKWDNKYSEVKNEIVEADFSDKSSIFQLCRLALVEDDEKFYEKLIFFIENENVGDWEIGIEQFLEWPIFNDYKAKEYYLNIINQYFSTDI